MRALQTDVREEKLPKWAAEALTDLRRKVTELETDIHNLVSKTTVAPFFLQRFQTTNPYYLPENQRLLFDWKHTKLDLNLREAKHGRLTIYSLEGSLIVHPRGANVVELESERR